MKARLIRIGNSRGVRLPKPVIEEAGLSEDVDIRVQDGGGRHHRRHEAPVGLGGCSPEGETAG